MGYRTKTYVAGAWDEDYDAIEKLYEWNENDYFSLEFSNVHDFQQSRDGSLYCSIKKSLSERMDRCKVFVLIVGTKTNKITKGACYNCRYYYYNHYYQDFACLRGGSISNKSYIEFECDRAKKDYLNGKIKILVLYNSSYVYKDRCPDSIREIAEHVAMKTDGKWNYLKVKIAFQLVNYHK